MRIIIRTIMVLCLLVAGKVCAFGRGIDSVSSGIPPLVLSGGFGLGWGSVGSTIDNRTVESPRVPLVFAGSISYPLHVLHPRFFVMGTAGVTLGLAFMAAKESDFAYTSLDVNVPLLVGIQYGGVRRGLMPFGLGLAIGPSIKYESQQLPGVVALTSMAEVVFIGSSEFRIRAMLEILPGSSDLSGQGSSRFLKHSNVQFLWSTKL